MSRPKVDPKKEEQDRMQGILLDMLKEEENKYCADCSSKTPRWAAWNLGVFICIRCAGIHRNLGVHISKVRSVNLDSWSAEQVQSMRVMGNEKARKVYEHSLPEHFRRSMSDHQLEQFIRAKYDQKRYIMKDFVYPRVDASEIPKPGQPTTKRTPVAVIRNPQNIAAAPAPPAAAPVCDLLDFSASSQPATVPSQGSNIFDDFGGLTIGSENVAAVVPAQAQSTASSDFDDMFGAFVSAPSAAVAQVSPNNSMPQSNNDLLSINMNSCTNGNGTHSSEDSKKSSADIMSLFGSAPAPTQLIAPGGFAAFGMQAVPAAHPPPQSNHFAAFDAPSHGGAQGGAASLMGLNMGGIPPQMNMGMGRGMHSAEQSAFPNPFGAPGGMSGMFAAPMAAPQMAPVSPSYSIPNKTNAFADLSLGKVMSSMNMPHRQGGHAVTAAPVAPVSGNNMNFDDLLGL